MNENTNENPNYSFQMTIEDVFFINGRGTIATGKVEHGEIHLNDDVVISTENGKLRSKVTALEVFRKSTESASAGENVGLALENISQDQIKHGDIIVR